MARDATTISIPNREAITNYGPALAQYMVDNFIGPVHLKLPIAFGTADAATLATVPTGSRLLILRAYWQITTTFAGGTNSAIGVSSDDTDCSTKGDILGGAGGDLTATLVSTGRVYKGGTLGAKFGTNGVVVVGSGKIIRYDKVVDAYTSGVGFVHIDGVLID
jgi:hypothetical protein